MSKNHFSFKWNFVVGQNLKIFFSQSRGKFIYQTLGRVKWAKSRVHGLQINGREAHTHLNSTRRNRGPTMWSLEEDQRGWIEASPLFHGRRNME